MSYTERKDDLLERRRQLLRQVGRLEDDLRWLETDVEPELVEAGQDAMLAQLAARLDDHDRAELVAIDHALDRIAGGADGLCRSCRRPIPEARLRALPTADTCVACAAVREDFTRYR